MTLMKKMLVKIAIKLEYMPNGNGPSGKDLLTKAFTLKGSSFPKHFQDGLKLCKRALMKRKQYH